LIKPYFTKLGKKIEVRDFVPRDQLLIALRKMDFLINFENGTSVQSPSKLIDYAIVKKPILSISPKKLPIDHIQEFLNPIVSTIEEIMNYLNLKGVVSTKANGIQILLSFSEEIHILDRIKEFNIKIVESITNKFNNLDIKIGVGRVYKDLDNVDKSFQDAIRTVRIGKAITSNEIVTFDELGIFKILSQDSLTDELEDFYNTTLKPLVDYDKKKSTELVKTLDSYFKNNGNLTRISEQMFAHYNTILYRIGRIIEITGMELENPNHRLNLEIAIKIKELLGK